MKRSKKIWEDFVQWLRSKCVTTVKDFQKYFEWKWFASMNSEWLRVKVNNDACKVNAKVNENNRQSAYKYENKCDEIEEQSKGLIGVFINNKLIIIDDNCNFTCRRQEDVSRFFFNE